jgi:polyisoprenoid-binding protein YceI
MKRLLIMLGFSLALPLAVHAVEFSQVQADKSTIQFAYKQMGVAMDGKFRKFAAQLNFDPAKPAAAKAIIDVDLASIDTGSTEVDQEVVGKQWFNAKAYPTARFVSDNVKPLGGNRYEATGKLTMKGRTKDIVAPLTLTAQGKQGAFDGVFSFKRSDFAIGEGEWSAFDLVANDIQIKFHILANPGK